MEELHRFRKEKRLTQKKIAENLGISLSYYSKIEKGLKPPSYNFITCFIELYPEFDERKFFGAKEHQK